MSMLVLIRNIEEMDTALEVRPIPTFFKTSIFKSNLSYQLL